MEVSDRSRGCSQVALTCGYATTCEGRCDNPRGASRFPEPARGARLDIPLFQGITLMTCLTAYSWAALTSSCDGRCSPVHSQHG